MKKTVLSILALLLPLFLDAQSLPPTGITPYTFNIIWGYMKSGNFEPSQLDKAEQLLTTARYRKVGKFDRPIGYTLVYAKACNVKMSSEGFVKSASPNKEPGFSSYIEVGPGVGMDWDMSVTFMSQKGTNAFIELLKKGQYTYYATENAGWVRKSDGCYFFQHGKTFSVSDVVGGDEIME
ncbi:MAG: hypothetical protein IKH26_12720 [Bacteroidaceae bacterium]|nr:hypothetical protein [Bacteroidaceae bacterium]